MFFKLSYETEFESENKCKSFGKLITQEMGDERYK